MESMIKMLRLIADPTRIRILSLLASEELSVAELQEILAMGQSRISSQLAQLKRAGLVEDRRSGKNIIYALKKSGEDSESRDTLFRTIELAAGEIEEIERDEAAASGLTVVTLNKYDFLSILRETEDQLTANVELYRRAFADLGVSGRVGFYGKADQGRAWTLLNTLNAQLENVTVYGDFETTLIDEARATKDATEAARIQEMGRRTCRIMGRTIDFLRSHQVGEKMLLQGDGTPGKGCPQLPSISSSSDSGRKILTFPSPSESGLHIFTSFEGSS